MRTLLLLAVFLVGGGCKGPSTCAELTCTGGQVCGFTSQTPECFTPCGLDGGGCSSGSCGCAGSCPGCENCIRVCP